MNWFGRKNKSAVILRNPGAKDIIDIKINPVDSYLGAFNPAVITGNTVTLFNEISEVSFPVMAIVNRICNGKFILKEVKTDSIVYECDEINKFLSQPNPLQSFDEFIRQAIIYKLVTGRSFIYSSMADFISTSMRWKMCDNYYVLPAHNTNIVYQDRIRLLSSQSLSDIIKSYKTTYGNEILDIQPRNILHLKDACVGSGINHLEGSSRLEGLKYPLANLMAVYEARNAIYIKRGALGAIVSKKQDMSGSIALTKTEKDTIKDDYNSVYGITGGRDNILITNVPIEFIRFSQSIQELMPFDETLEDAVQIAGKYNIPSVLIPRKDQGTFSNQAGAEKSLYENTVIPEAKAFCQALNSFLGLENDGLFLDVSFEDIPALQENSKEKAITDKLVSDACKLNFISGVITLNDWVAKAGGTRVDDEIYNKHIFQMTDEEMTRIERFIR